MSRRGQRTSRIWIVVRTGLAIYAVIAVPSLLVWLITGICLFTLSLPALLGAVGGIALWMFANSIWTRFGAWFLLCDDPKYQQWRRDGFDPYWDNLPPPINNDSWSVRLTGQEEQGLEHDPNVDANGLATKPCPSCQVSVKEPWAGCFFTGVRCWNCQKVMRACPSCFNLVGEPVVGGFASPQGVQCPFCGAVMRP